MAFIARRGLPLFLTALTLALSSACGTDYLSPEDVRSHLLLPRGSVDADTVGRVTDDFMNTQEAQGAESFAFFLKSSESGDDSASAWAAELTASGDTGAMEKAVSYGAAEDISDIFCAASLVAAIASFDDCDQNASSCEVKLTIDSCVFRIGEGGDDNARGSIIFELKSDTGEGWSREQLSITFDELETTNSDGNMDFLGGLIAIEATEIGTGYSEVIFSADIDEQERTVERGFLDDGMLWRKRVTAAARFTAQDSAEVSSGTMDIVAFVDDNDDTRDESVIITFAAESRQIDEDTELAGATLIVRGSNGAFTCTWEAASEEREGSVSSYDSNGSCLDEDSGETFEWASSYEVGEDA